MNGKDPYHYAKPAPFATIAIRDDASIVSEFTGIQSMLHEPSPAVDQPVVANRTRLKRPDTDDSNTPAPLACKRPVLYPPPAIIRSVARQNVQGARVVGGSGMEYDRNIPAPVTTFQQVPSAPPEVFQATAPHQSSQVSGVNMYSQLRNIKSNPQPPAVFHPKSETPRNNVPFYPTYRKNDGTAKTSAFQVHGEVHGMGMQDVPETVLAVPFATTEKCPAEPAGHHGSQIGEQRMQSDSNSGRPTGVAAPLPTVQEQPLIAETLEMPPKRQSVPLQKAQRPSRQSEEQALPVRSSKQSLLILEDRSSTKTTQSGTKVAEHSKTVHPKQPSTSSSERLFKAFLEANQQNGNECLPKSFGEQFAEEAFHNVGLDEEEGGGKCMEEVRSKEPDEGNILRAKMACCCLICLLGLVIAGVPTYLVLFK